jgi:hypothetical protein
VATPENGKKKKPEQNKYTGKKNGKPAHNHLSHPSITIIPTPIKEDVRSENEKATPRQDCETQSGNR